MQNNLHIFNKPQAKTASSPLNPNLVQKSTERMGGLLRELQNDASSTNENQSAYRTQRDTAAMLRVFTITDTCALLLGVFTAWILTACVNAEFYQQPMLNSAKEISRVAQFLLIGSGVLVWFEHTSHYHVRLPFWIEMRKIVGTIGFAMLIDGFIQFASKQEFSRLWLVSGWIFAGIGMVMLRAIWRRKMRRAGEWSLPTLLVGAGRHAEDLRNALASEPGLGYDVVGQIDDVALAFQDSGMTWRALCAKYGAEYVMIAPKSGEMGKGDQALAQLMREDVPYSIAPSLYRAPVYGMVPQYFFNHDVMLLTHNHGLDRDLPCLVKRSFDVAVAATALVVFSPILAIVAFFVALDGGAPLYGHKRLGMNGKPFACLKFRSMVTNSSEVLKRHLEKTPAANAEWQRDFKLRDDPRVTRVGKILRKTSLDELPQLINVLKGDMSIVGPRPIIVAETKKYSNDISHYYRVRPGITGLWQASGRNDVSYAERVHMDTWYVHNWSVWHDIAIICKTIPSLLNRNGAY